MRHNHLLSSLLHLWMNHQLPEQLLEVDALPATQGYCKAWLTGTLALIKTLRDAASLLRVEWSLSALTCSTGPVCPCHTAIQRGGQAKRAVGSSSLPEYAAPVGKQGFYCSLVRVL